MASGSILGATSNPYISARLVWSSTADVAGNKSSVTVSLSYKRSNAETTTGTGSFTITIDGTTYTFSNLKLTIKNEWITAATKTVTVAHNADGTKSISINATGALTGTSLSSTTFLPTPTITLDAIPRASSLTVPSFSFGSASSFTITRASSSFRHKLIYWHQGVQHDISAVTTNTSVSWTPDVSMMHSIPSATALTLTVRLLTYQSDGSTLIGYKDYAVTISVPASVKPTCTVVCSDTEGLLSIYGKYVAGRSVLHVKTTATMAYSSPIRIYSVSVDGETYSGADIDIGTLAVGNHSVNVRVSDNRGRVSNTVSLTVQVLAYAPPSVILSAVRCNAGGTADEEGAYLQVVLSGSISSLDSQNSATYNIEYKKTEAMSWTTLATGTGTSYSSDDTAIDLASAYSVRATITDDLSNRSKTADIAVATVLLDFKASGKGMGIGQISTADEELQIGWDVRLKGDLMGDHIVAYGVNSNGFGEYVKFASGNMICWREITVTIACNSAWGSMYLGRDSTAWNFAQTFISAPKCIVQYHISTGNASFIPAEIDLPVITTTQYKGLGIVRPTSHGGVGVRAVIIAIGRWR